MNEESPLQRLIDLVRAPDAAPPRVDPVEAHVRSGVQFIFRDQQKRGVTADLQESLSKADWLLGGFVVEWGFDVKQGMAGQLHRWLADHEHEIVAEQPDDVQYRGTYAVFSTSEKRSGTYRTIWTFKSFAGMQNLGWKLSDKSSAFTRLVTDLVAFIDRDREAGTSQQIYQPAQGALSIWQLVEPPNPVP